MTWIWLLETIYFLTYESTPEALTGLFMAGNVCFLINFVDSPFYIFIEFDKFIFATEFGIFYLSFSDRQVEFDNILSTENLFFGSLSFIILKSLFLGTLILSRSLNYVLLKLCY